MYFIGMLGAKHVPSVDKQKNKENLFVTIMEKVVKLRGFIICYFIRNADKHQTSANCLRETIFKVQ